MFWLLSLHIAALLFWAAGLLYLTAVVSSGEQTASTIPEPLPGPHGSLARFIYTHLATPAALLAIMAGTGVFLINDTVTVWLIAKLSLVAALVLCHVAMGILVLWSEAQLKRPVRLLSGLLAGVIALLLTAIVWVVLAKPQWEALPWQL